MMVSVHGFWLYGFWFLIMQHFVSGYMGGGWPVFVFGQFITQKQ